MREANVRIKLLLQKNRRQRLRVSFAVTARGLVPELSTSPPRAELATAKSPARHGGFAGVGERVWVPPKVSRLPGTASCAVSGRQFPARRETQELVVFGQRPRSSGSPPSSARGASVRSSSTDGPSAPCECTHLAWACVQTESARDAELWCEEEEAGKPALHSLRRFATTTCLARSSWRAPSDIPAEDQLLPHQTVSVQLSLRPEGLPPSPGTSWVGHEEVTKNSRHFREL
ncbi:uncharacterized protein LOC124247274 [Equus quagga]|uniref:uncharacterized protein LOC124247274 n=1 Tax=Equus quagga TaxID=89248 RepID=UPI001EE2CF0A|nr:uncharacterized protein LOC124247274 [Equus quagga]